MGNKSSVPEADYTLESTQQCKNKLLDLFGVKFRATSTANQRTYKDKIINLEKKVVVSLDTNLKGESIWGISCKGSTYKIYGENDILRWQIKESPRKMKSARRARPATTFSSSISSYDYILYDVMTDRDYYLVSAQHDTEYTNEVNIDAKCTICIDANREVVLLPCRHLIMCICCSVGLKQCPIDRVPIKKIILVHT